MKVEFTFAQLCKLSKLSPESWKALLSFVKEGGSGDFSPDLSPVKEAGLLHKAGPLAYVKFYIDGAKPQQLPQVARSKRSGHEMGAFMSVWREKFGKSYITGRDMAALKRFTFLYSLDEFKLLVKRFWASPFSGDGGSTLHNLWGVRAKLVKSDKSATQVFGGDDDD